MKCIVPLAGPDLQTDAYGLRPLFEVGGQTILERALRGRAWSRRLAPQDYIFVVREVPDLPRLEAYLTATWPGSRTVVLSDLTGGALFSVLAAMALTAPGEPLIVDLADIVFATGPEDPEALIGEGFDAVVPVFKASDACYSYLRIEDGRVVEAREKVVISDNASAGVYMFRDLSTFLTAAVHSLDNRDALSYKNALFICPMVNGVINAGGKVAAPSISDPSPVGKMFHGDV